MRNFYLTVGLIMITGFLLVKHLNSKKNENLISFFQTRDLLVNDERAIFEQKLPQLLKNTVFENKWQINGQYKKDHLNIYLFEIKSIDTSLAPTDFRKVINNCSYIGDNTIVFDMGYAKNFLYSYKVDKIFREQFRQEEMKIHQKVFLSWILGHELGHIINGDSPKHFEANSLDKEASLSETDIEIEFNADAFYIEQVGKDSTSLFNTKLLLELLYTVETKKRHGGTIDPNGLVGVYDKDSGTHPTIFNRAGYMFLIMSKYLPKTPE